MPRKISPTKKFKRKADNLFSLIIRSRGYCEAEGYGGRDCSNQLQTAHIISRRYNSTRTDLRNAFCLCMSHHSWYTDHPREFSKFITDTWAQDYYDGVYQKSLLVGKLDWQERAELLKDVYERLQQGKLTIEEARKHEQ